MEGSSEVRGRAEGAIVEAMGPWGDCLFISKVFSSLKSLNNAFIEANFKSLKFTEPLLAAPNTEGQVQA